jgi:DNA repair protein RadC
MSTLQEKILTHFEGKVVRKDLTSRVKGNAVVPAYVLEFLLGQYCDLWKAFHKSHNHPSGNLVPSEADKDINKKIKEAGKFLDIPVLDHLILTPESYLSFADEGLM